MKKILRFKIKNNKKIFLMVFFWIFVLEIVLFNFFNNKMAPKILYIAQKNLDKYVDEFTNDFQIYLDEIGKYEEFIELNLNSNGEILSVDYNMEEIYALANELTKYLENGLEKAYLTNTIPYSSSNYKHSLTDGLILDMPMGLVSNSPFLANLGPKIPVCIRFIDSIFSNVRTRLTDYGINNALLEVYLNVTVSYEILLPVTKNTQERTYELLIDSKLVQGKVPNWYSNGFENQTAFFELPFN